MTDHDCPTCHMMPGSDTAVRQGCTCPILDNGHGHAEWMVVNVNCPVDHPTRAAKTPMRRVAENRTCDMPSPGDYHCTDRPAHDWSCYDARGDVSFNDRQDWTHHHPGRPSDGHTSEER